LYNHPLVTFRTIVVPAGNKEDTFTCEEKSTDENREVEVRAVPEVNEARVALAGLNPKLSALEMLAVVELADVGAAEGNEVETVEETTRGLVEGSPLTGTTLEELLTLACDFKETLTRGPAGV